MREKFWQLPLDELTRQEWEALCDGCGRCCLHKLIDSDTEKLHYTRIACKLYDLENSCCSDYVNRTTKVPECADFQQQLKENIAWMPSTCAYRLRWEGKALPDWHYLISGDSNKVHELGISIKNFAKPNSIIGHEDDYFQHLLEQVL